MRRERSQGAGVRRDLGRGVRRRPDGAADAHAGGPHAAETHASDAHAIDAELPPAGPPSPPPPDDALLDRIHGGWLGRCAGAHVTGGPHEVLDRCDAVDRAVLTLRLLETYGPGFTTEQMASQWLLTLPFLRPSGAERAAYRMLVDGVVAPGRIGTVHTPEPSQEGDGALRRADLYGYVAPGDPRRAARLARKDAQLSHAADGLYGAMWIAAVTAAAFTARDATEAVALSLRHIPPRSRLFDALCEVLVAHARGRDWTQVVDHIHGAHDRHGPQHAVGNACLIAAGLLWGAGDWTRTVSLTVRGGWDTPVDAAAAGSVAGVLGGTEAVPAEWRRAAVDRVRTAVPDAGECRITDLAERTWTLARTAAL